jgi:glyoxylase-like metal-dependent hydrolase (beta-lactamase superfamily II)
MAAEVEQVAPGVLRLRTLFVNLFFVSDQPGEIGSWWLVDAGLHGTAGLIRRTAEECFGTGTYPRAIVLTHGHFDHVGALRTLAQEWDVPIYAHRLEYPYLTGRSKYPPPDPSVGGGGMAWLSALYPRGPFDVSRWLQALPENGRVPGAADWQWVATPGHSPGHVSLFREADRLLIAGDAVVTTKPESMIAALTQRAELHGPPAYFTPDWQASASSARMLAALEPEILTTGHGPTMRGQEMRAALRDLADNFDREIPSRGRYVPTPARVDDRGVISVPPRPLPSMATLAVTAVVAGATAYSLFGTRRRR